MCFRTRDFAQKHLTVFQAHSQSFQASSRHSDNCMRRPDNRNAWNRPSHSWNKLERIGCNHRQPKCVMNQVRTKKQNCLHYEVYCLFSCYNYPAFCQAQIGHFEVRNFSSRAAHVLRFNQPVYAP